MIKRVGFDRPAVVVMHCFRKAVITGQEALI